MTIASGKDLSARVAAGGATVRLFDREAPLINLSSLVIWIMGCSAACIASWNSARAERAALRPGSGRSGRGRTSVQHENPELAITMTQAVAFLVCSSVLLVGLYFLIQAGVNVVVVRAWSAAARHTTFCCCSPVQCSLFGFPMQLSTCAVA